MTFVGRSEASPAMAGQPPECGCSTGDTEQVLLTGLGWRQGPCPVTIGLLSQGLEFYLMESLLFFSFENNFSF